MPQMTIEQALRLAVERHQGGRLIEARHLYEQVLRIAPDHPDALNLLGVLHTQLCDTSTAETFLRRAIIINPAVAAFHNNLGTVLKLRGQLEEAVDEFRFAADCPDGSAEALANLGHAYRAIGELKEAESAFSAALQINVPINVEARLRTDRGAVLAELNRLEESLSDLTKASDLNREYPLAHFHLGNVLARMGRTDEAQAAQQRALNLKKDLYEAAIKLGDSLIQKGRLDDGIAAFRRAADTAPEQVDVYLRLAAALNLFGQPDQSLQACKRVLAEIPNFGPMLRVLGDLYFSIAAHQASLESLTAAIEFDVTHGDNGHSARIFTRMFTPGQSQEAQADDQRLWDDRYGRKLRPASLSFPNNPDPDRRLKIGSVSPNFRGHCQAFFMMPVLTFHDPKETEIYCFSDVHTGGPVTEMLASRAHHWRQIYGLSDEQVVSQIRSDEIDILVDLTMHMSETRLKMFARKPAPVQATWLAYPGSTGLSAIDYRLSDPHLDPPGMFDHLYVEKTVRLQDSFWVYDPLDPHPSVKDLPAKSNGFITFGCLNNFGKVNQQLIQLWSRVLNQAPTSRFLLSSPAGAHRQWVLDGFGSNGVESERIEFVGRLPRLGYLETYHRIDVTLDTVPYNGHTTSLDSMWMGVPIVTRVGKTVVGRGGLSQLTNMGMTELIAYNDEQFVAIAMRLASDLEGLAALRTELRTKLQSSPLMDGQRFVKSMEAAYRKMWREWCDQQRDSSKACR